MENNKNKKSVKFQGDMLNFCDFIQVFVFTRNHHLNQKCNVQDSYLKLGGILFRFSGLRVSFKLGFTSVHKFYTF